MPELGDGPLGQMGEAYRNITLGHMLGVGTTEEWEVLRALLSLLTLLIYTLKAPLETLSDTRGSMSSPSWAHTGLPQTHRLRQT